MVDFTHDYNELIPPSNPDYQDWQPLCYYCNQPIRWVGYRQWEHVNPVTGGNKWTNGSCWHCDPQFIRPTNEIDDPRCHCGTQEAGKHADLCSAVGKPPFRATSFSGKEEELRIYWDKKKADGVG